MRAPFLLRPVYKDYLWGGTRLLECYGKKSGTSRLAESWELSALPGGSSVVASGPYSGQLLIDLWRGNSALFGASAACAAGFPLLIKLLDSSMPLSVQVHPDDAYALAAENAFGKCEMWVILDAAPDAGVYLGFIDPVEKDEIARRVHDGSLLDVMRRIPVAPGDVLYVSPGTVHAIGAGITLAEIQQSSDITYRLYDHGRVGSDGRPRELHLEKALRVLTAAPADPSPPGAALPENVHGGILEKLTENPCFTVYRLDLQGRCERPVSSRSFVSVVVLAGEALLTANGVSLPAKKGDSLLVPAGTGTFALEGHASLLLCSV